jgi:phosphohistidine phosphatase
MKESAPSSGSPRSGRRGGDDRDEQQEEQRLHGRSAYNRARKEKALGLTLHLLRHAKSSWDVAGQDDHDRVLNARGRKSADKLGEFLAREGPLPARVLCSTAARTRETWARLRPSLERAGAPPAVDFERSLYLASAGELLGRIRGCGEEPCLLVVAHNPGIADLARGLAGSGDEDARHRLRGKYPTAGLATLVFDAVAWSDVAASGGELLRFTIPRDL